ncbi:MAG: TetR/AcrR family transcriptional regulator, fatty acid metabolism regulator protein [Acidobacteriota bacterium]|nr:TetR/AcrR family transcriptional regulator, fatty acid metabolism regulator protein [Acidobacteriota bacterium]
MTTPEADSTQTSRSRLLNAGKLLFSRNGYEQTSTAAIARESGSSESQLIRYFGGKSGLLEAIFNDGWSGLNDSVRLHMEQAEHGRDAILRILSLMIEGFANDHDIAFLFLFEGRRLRGNSREVLLSKGFMHFISVVHALIEKGQADGSFRNDVDAKVLCSAMLGTAEGMVRDWVMSERAKEEHPFTNEAIKTAFAAMVNGLAP